MMADAIRFRSRQGKQIRNPIAPANILRLPAAGCKGCNDTYFIGPSATLRLRQEHGWHRRNEFQPSQADPAQRSLPGVNVIISTQRQ